MKLDINFKDIDIIDLSNLIFQGQPKPKNSIPICLEDNNTEEIYKILLQLFTYGMKIKYGDNNGVVKLCDLDDNDYKYIKIYIESIGYTFYYKIYDINEINNINILNNDKQNLKDYIFHIQIKDTNKIFILWFEKL